MTAIVIGPNGLPVTIDDPGDLPLQALPFQYEIDGLTLGSFDDADCWWIVRQAEGWLSPPKPKAMRTVRPQAPGSFRAAAFRGERIIALTGSTRCPDAITRLGAVDRLAAVAGDPTRLHRLTVTDATGQARTADVELDDATSIRLHGPYRWFDWQMQLAAPDPLRYDATWQAPRSTMLDAGTPGLDWGASGVSFGAAGLDWGQPGTNLVSQVANFGTARTFPVFEIHGPVNTPRVTDLATGAAVDYAGELYVGDVVTINCGEFPVTLPGDTGRFRGDFPARSAFLNTFTDQRVLLTVPQLWPSVGPGEVHNYQLSGNGISEAVLIVYLRSAWF